MMLLGRHQNVAAARAMGRRADGESMPQTSAGSQGSSWNVWLGEGEFAALETP